jgi:hypothetical protein
MTMAHDRLQRLDALRREGILTDAEYEAKCKAIILGEPSQLSTSTASSERDAGQVLLGALGGLILGLAFIGALLVFVPREKRADRLFGGWLGTALGAVAVAIVIALASAASGSGDYSTSAQQPVYAPPTAVSSLLTDTEACQVAQDYGYNNKERTNWVRCIEARYRAEDRTWVVTLEWVENQDDVTPIDTGIKLIDDRCGRPVGYKGCE